jgi:hypothetical protein
VERLYLVNLYHPLNAQELLKKYYIYGQTDGENKKYQQTLST